MGGLFFGASIAGMVLMIDEDASHAKFVGMVTLFALGQLLTVVSLLFGVGGGARRRTARSRAVDALGLLGLRPQ